MKLFPYLLAGSIFMQSAYPADSPEYNPAENRCQSVDDGFVARALDQLAFADRVLPNVPPEEARYLEAESARMTRLMFAETDPVAHPTPAEQIFRNLQTRPLYRAWKLRKSLLETQNAFRRILQRQPHPEKLDYDFFTYTNNEAEKLDRAAGAFSSVATYSNEVNNFLNDGKESTFSAKDSQQLTYLAVSLPLGLEKYVKCKLAKTMGRQPIIRP